MNRISDYIDESDSIPEARLKPWGIHVWAIAGYLPVYDGDVEAIARAYDIPVEAAQAAVRYYKKHKHLINGRLAMNDDPPPLKGALADYIDQGWGVADARLKASGVQVWAIIGYLKAAQGDEEWVAGGYDIPVEAVRAARAYYKKHKAAIDARLAMNDY